MSKQYLLYGILLLGITQVTAAQAATNASAPQGRNNAVFEAALSACAQSSAKDNQGGPDHAAMDACMQSKGFTRLPDLPSVDRPHPPAFK